MKIDLDELERKAIAGMQDARIALPGTALVVGPNERAHITANAPPVTLALIARIRELEELVRAAVVLDQLDPASKSVMRCALEKGPVLP